MMHFLFTKTPLAYFVASFWRDEAFSYLMAKLPLHTLLWSTAQDANPPLYYLLLKVWMGFFGSSEIAIRSLSLIFFWATLYVVFLILNDVFKLSERKSMAYLLLFIINPLLHYYAFEARMYSMTAFIATLLFYALMKRKYKLYAYTAITAMFTHYFLFIVIAFQAVFFFFSSHKTERKQFFLPLFKVGLWYIPWIILLLFAGPPIGQSFWVPTSNFRDFFLIPAIIFTGYEKTTWVIYKYLPHLSVVIAGIILVAVRLHAFHQKKRYLALLLGWALGIPLFIFILSFWKPVFLPRYLIFTNIGLLLLLIIGIEGIRNIRIRIGAIALLVIFSFIFATAQVLLRVKAPLKNTFNSIKQQMLKTDVVYVTNEYDFHPAQYYLPSRKVYIYKKTYEELPWFVGKVLIDKGSFRTSLPIYPERAFIVNDKTYTIQSSR